MSYMSGKSGAIFVDTNVLVYAYDRHIPDKHQIARDLMNQLWQARSGCLSIQVLQEFYVTITRKIAAPLSSLEASNIISDLAQWGVHSPLPADVIAAIDLQQRHRLLFWDAMIINSALRLGCTQVLTEDLNAGQVIEDVEIVNPFI